MIRSEGSATRQRDGGGCGGTGNNTLGIPGAVTNGELEIGLTTKTLTEQFADESLHRERAVLHQLLADLHPVRRVEVRVQGFLAERRGVVNGIGRNHRVLGLFNRLLVRQGAGNDRNKGVVDGREGHRVAT